jgi:ATP-dependent Lon protease
MVVPLFVGREKSVKALDEIMKGEKQILLATQKNSVDDDPSPDAIYPIGVLATVLQLLKLPDGTVKVLVEGKGRARLTQFTDRRSISRPKPSRSPTNRATLPRPKPCCAPWSSSSKTM